MKGIQGERLRQAFKYLDKDEDGFIRPEQFKRIIMVGAVISRLPLPHPICRKSQGTSSRAPSSNACQRCAR